MKRRGRALARRAMPALVVFALAAGSAAPDVHAAPAPGPTGLAPTAAAAPSAPSAPSAAPSVGAPLPAVTATPAGAPLPPPTAAPLPVPTARPLPSPAASPVPPSPTPDLHPNGQFAGFDDIRTNGRIQVGGNGDFTIPQRFTAIRDTTQIEADRATGNYRRKLLHATGSVVVHQNGPVKGRNDKTASATSKPSTLTCDQLDVDGVRKTYAATGNVHYSQVGGRDATSDTATLDDADHHLHMQGHVHVKDGEQDLYTDTLDYDTLTGELDLLGSVEGRAPLDTPAPAAAATPKPSKKKKRK